MTDKEIINGLSQTVESQKQTFDALLRKYQNLERVFEEILVDKFAISELRDFYRQRAGIIK